MSTTCSEVTTKVCNETHLGVVLIYSKNGMDSRPASHCRRRCEATKSDAARHVVSALCAAHFISLCPSPSSFLGPPLKGHPLLFATPLAPALIFCVPPTTFFLGPPLKGHPLPFATPLALNMFLEVCCVKPRNDLFPGGPISHPFLSSQ